MEASLGTIMIYARNMEKSAEFYSKLFNFKTTGKVVDGLIELTPTCGGAGILIHQAAKSIKLGQVGVKLSFHVQDVANFISIAKQSNIEFGPIHEAKGYQFSNTKDPDGNSVSISSRSFRDQ
ncbi:VOC family protein [Spartinivicinus poritis]|uniref:VOC family protein n=1 Tax=Spartinivicinus poritis TaxID=2994640 RepID=A0ABT5UDX8_9GAMM|nr:VOC family protein [Spartinivicinus sp. A2-2]MDE1463722.1 VOC family protein [Spartinivicinus sp. A2-2]